MDEEFNKAFAEAWGFIKGDGSFTGNELKEWSKSLSEETRDRVLRILIQVAWCDYGGQKGKKNEI